MSISYKKLCVSADISPSLLAKLEKSENTNTDILVKICIALNYNVSDIMGVKPVFTEKEESENEKHSA